MKMITPSFKPSAIKELRPDLEARKALNPAPAPKKQKTPTYNLTEQQISDMKKQAAKEAVEVAWTLMLGLPCMPLLDKFGFSSEDLERFLDELMDYYDSYEKGYITLKDVHDVVLEEGGCDIIEMRVKARHSKHPKKGPYRRSKR